MKAVAQPQVVIVQHSIRRYRAPFFEQLRARLHDTGIGLRLLLSDHPAYLQPNPQKADIPWAEVRVGRRFWIRDETLLWQPVLGDSRHARLVVVEQAAQLLANYPLLARQALGGPPVAFWGHGRNFLAEDERSLAERVKRLASTRVRWWFAYNDLSADVVARMGFPRERITSVQNATDTRRLAAAVAAVSEQQRAALRAELGLEGTNLGLFAGTLGAVKHLDYLFAAADAIRSRVPDFELVLAGNGREEPVVTAWAAERSWASYAGPCFDEGLAPLLAMAKVMLVPSWAGLVIVDSFGAGVPLVASASFPHPPEIDYLRDGVNGLLVDDGGEPERYAAAVADLLHDEDRRMDLTRGCETARHRYSIETMAERFTDGIMHALEAGLSARTAKPG